MSAKRIESETDHIGPEQKASFGPGPWIDEPDRKEWRHAGLPCLIVRQDLGALCGYVGVPPGHPAHGQDYGSVDVSVHGGLTYGDRCTGKICHQPQPGETDEIWWLGFDCAHAFDLVPGLVVRLPGILRESLGGEYRTIEYVEGEVNQLAEQLRAMVQAG